MGLSFSFREEKRSSAARDILITLIEYVRACRVRIIAG